MKKFENHYEILRVLFAYLQENAISSPMDIIQNETGKTFLHLAITAGGEDFFKLILCQNPNLNIRDKQGKTALHYLIRHPMSKEKYINRTSEILAHGADVNAIDNKKNTAFHIFIEHCTEPDLFLQIYYLFKDRGIDPNIRSDKYGTMLEQLEKKENKCKDPFLKNTIHLIILYIKEIIQKNVTSSTNESLLEKIKQLECDKLKLLQELETLKIANSTENNSNNIKAIKISGQPANFWNKDKNSEITFIPSESSKPKQEVNPLKQSLQK